MTDKPTPQDVDAFLDSTAGWRRSGAVRGAARPAMRPDCRRSRCRPSRASSCRCWPARLQARRILEIGTLGGFSTIWLARGAGPQGRVVTLEYEPKHAEVARANLQRAGVADRVEVMVGAALDTLPTVTGGPFDLVFIDADKENYVAYLEWAIRLARPGAIIVADNVIREGRVLTATSEDTAASRCSRRCR